MTKNKMLPAMAAELAAIQVNLNPAESEKVKEIVGQVAEIRKLFGWKNPRILILALQEGLPFVPDKIRQLETPTAAGLKAPVGAAINQKNNKQKFDQ